MQRNVIIANFRKVVFKKKTLISKSDIKEGLVEGNFNRRTRFVTRSTCTVRLVTRSFCLTTRSTGLATRSTCLTTYSTRSTIYRSFDDWLYLWTENSQLCLINAAHEHFITQTGEKSKKHIKHMCCPGTKGTRAEKLKYPERYFVCFALFRVITCIYLR